MYEIERKLESICPYIQNKPKQIEFILDKDGNWVENPRLPKITL